MQRDDIGGVIRDARELSDAMEGLDSTADELMMLFDEGIAETLPAEREIVLAAVTAEILVGALVVVMIVFGFAALRTIGALAS